jgi:hypothetical protein
MRLDHVSYVASHDQISDVVNRIGSQISTAFIDGGIHPKFGTRNFTAPLLNGRYIEIVCPMEHPATELTPFGRVVKKKANEGGGWLTWVFSSTNLELIEKQIGRKSVDGKRKKPDGTELSWKQLGVLSTLEDFSHPFYIEWISQNHPSQDGIAVAAISKINIVSNNKKLLDAPGINEIEKSNELDISWSMNAKKEIQMGIISIEFSVGSQIVVLQ